MIISGELEYKHVEALVQSRSSRVVISSPGGDTSVSRALADEIMSRGLVTIGLGEVSSAAIAVFAAGVKRLARPSTVFLFHQPYVTGLESDLRAEGHLLNAAVLDSYYTWVCALLSETTELSFDEWRVLGGGEGRELSYEYAVEIGLVTGEAPKTLLKAGKPSAQ